jgi:hypothetical protein
MLHRTSGSLCPVNKLLKESSSSLDPKIKFGNCGNLAPKHLLSSRGTSEPLDPTNGHFLGIFEIDMLKCLTFMLTTFLTIRHRHIYRKRHVFTTLHTNKDQRYP